MEITVAENLDVEVVENQSLSSESGGIFAFPMLLVILGLALFIAFSTVLSYYLFISYRDKLARAHLEIATVQELKAYRAKEAAELNSYSVIVVPNGKTPATNDVIISLPIELGIEKAVEYYKQ